MLDAVKAFSQVHLEHASWGLGWLHMVFISHVALKAWQCGPFSDRVPFSGVYLFKNYFSIYFKHQLRETAKTLGTHIRVFIFLGYIIIPKHS